MEYSNLICKENQKAKTDYPQGASILQMAKVVGNATFGSLIIQRSGRAQISDDMRAIIWRIVSKLTPRNLREQLIETGIIEEKNWATVSEGTDYAEGEFPIVFKALVDSGDVEDVRTAMPYCTERFLRRHIIGLWIDGEQEDPTIFSGDDIKEVYERWRDNGKATVTLSDGSIGFIDGEYGHGIEGGKINHLINA